MGMFWATLFICRRSEANRLADLDLVFSSIGGGASEPPPILQPEWRGWWEGPGSQMT
jgi:hypothetical protein